MPTPSISISQPTLASRLNLLLDGRKVRNLPADFATIQAGVEARGASISRPRWAYVRQEHSSHRPRDTTMLAALAEFFGVDEAYLTEEQAPTPLILQRLIPDIRDQRVRAVREYAARLLGDLSPEKLAEIEQALTAA